MMYIGEYPKLLVNTIYIFSYNYIHSNTKWGRKKNTKFGSHNTSRIQYETIKTLAPIAQSSNWRAF